MQYHNNVTKQIHNNLTYLYEVAINMNTHNKLLHERCFQGGSKITLYIHTFRNK